MLFKPLLPLFTLLFAPAVLAQNGFRSCYNAVSITDAQGCIDQLREKGGDCEATVFGKLLAQSGSAEVRGSTRKSHTTSWWYVSFIEYCGCRGKANGMKLISGHVADAVQYLIDNCAEGDRTGGMLFCVWFLLLLLMLT